MTGAITSTYVGCAQIASTALKTLLDSVNVGAATAGAETTSIFMIPMGGSGQVAVWKIARAA
jgi:hypothetical protein